MSKDSQIVSSFTVTVDVPDTFLMEKITQDIFDILGKTSDQDKIRRAYAFSLREESWKYGIDWDAIRGKMTIPVPFNPAASHKIEEISNTNSIILALLVKIMEKVSIEGLMNTKNFFDKSLL